MKIALYTLGCKLNQAETDELKENLQKEGFFIVPWKIKADAYVINACSVTIGAEQGTRQIIRQAKKRNASAKIFVTGCFGQKLPEVDFVFKNKKILTRKIAQKLKKDSKIISSSCDNIDHKSKMEKNRTFIKIQTGCDNFCSYCTIPYFRGKPKSVAPRKIIETINKKVEKNFKEIVLTGVNVCKYNYKKLDLTKLVQKILKETKVERIRFGSLDPELINDDFISIFKNSRIMPHMHLSLQSGSDKILKLMNRKYTTQDYLNIVKKIRKQYPLFGFTTDIIIGFPGESEKDFKDTCEFVKKVKFSKIHLFPYSPRPKTAAINFKNQVPEITKKERFQKLQKITNKMQNDFIEINISKKIKILFEEKEDNHWFGYTPNYLRIKYRSKKYLKNKITEIKLNKGNFVKNG